MPSYTRATSLALAALLAACTDQPVTSVRDTAPRLSSAATACAASPTVVVHTDPELRAAVASAGAGDVIAISGTIPLDSSVVVQTEGITLTCAEPGAGLSFGPGNEFALLELYAGHVTVSGLTLDAEYGYSPILAFAVFNPTGIPNIRLTGNEIHCGYDFCLFGVGVPYLQITDNHFIGDETRFGIQIQALRQLNGTVNAPSDGIVISRNVIENDEGYLAVYGGIRVRDGRDVTITHNDVLGSWSNGIVLTNIYDSRVEQNRIDGALRDGIDLALIVANRVSISNVSFKANQISNVGRAGISARAACGNTFEGNNVQDNPVGARFEFTTGDNVYRGNHGVVQDGGRFDCDRDGDIDPNRVSGVPSAALRDTIPGPSHAPDAPRAGGRGIPALQ